MKFAKNSRTAYVANYLKNAVQVIDVTAGEVLHEIPLGGPKVLTAARRGMEIFYDGTRSLDQWYSCHSCHQDGGTNARPMDTMNDGSEMTLKTVLPRIGYQNLPMDVAWLANKLDGLHGKIHHINHAG